MSKKGGKENTRIFLSCQDVHGCYINISKSKEYLKSNINDDSFARNGRIHVPDAGVEATGSIENDPA